MKKKIIAGLGTLCLAASLVGSSPATDTAAAVDPCALAFGPNIVAVGLVPTEVRFDVEAVQIEGCQYYDYGWNVRLNRWDVDVTDRFPNAAFDPSYLPNSDTKPVSGEVRTFSPRENVPYEQEVLPYSFKLVHLTTWGTTIKAKRLDTTHVRLSGTLVRADWEKNKYLPHPAKRVDITKVGPVAQVELDAKGHFEIVVKAKAGPNSWTITYAGNSTSSPATGKARVTS